MIAGMIMTAASRAMAGRELATSVMDRVRLGDAPVIVVLAPVGQAPAPRWWEMAGDSPATLVLRDLTTYLAPKTGFDIFMNLPPGTISSRQDVGYVATVNFFGMLPPGVAERPRAVSYPIDAVLRELDRAGRLAGPLTVTFVPGAPPAAGARPEIGRVSVFLPN